MPPGPLHCPSILPIPDLYTAPHYLLSRSSLLLFTTSSQRCSSLPFTTSSLRPSSLPLTTSFPILCTAPHYFLTWLSSLPLTSSPILFTLHCPSNNSSNGHLHSSSHLLSLTSSLPLDNYSPGLCRCPALPPLPGPLQYPSLGQDASGPWDGCIR